MLLQNYEHNLYITGYKYQCMYTFDLFSYSNSIGMIVSFDIVYIFFSFPQNFGEVSTHTLCHIMNHFLMMMNIFCIQCRYVVFRYVCTSIFCLLFICFNKFDIIMLIKKWEKKIGKRQLHAFSLFLFLFLFLLLKSKENGFFALIRMNEKVVN